MGTAALESVVLFAAMGCICNLSLHWISHQANDKGLGKRQTLTRGDTCSAHSYSTVNYPWFEWIQSFGPQGKAMHNGGFGTGSQSKGAGYALR